VRGGNTFPLVNMHPCKPRVPAGLFGLSLDLHDQDKVNHCCVASRDQMNSAQLEPFLVHNLDQVCSTQVDQTLNVGLLEVFLELFQGHLILESQFPCFADVHLVWSKPVRLRGIPCNLHHLLSEVGQVDHCRGLSGLGGLGGLGGLAGHGLLLVSWGHWFLSSSRHLYPTI